MSFNSIEFLLFFPTVVILFFSIPHKLRPLLLLAASVFFYMMWNAWYIFLILFSTIVDYWCGIKMSSLEQKEERKPYLWVSLIANLGLLGFFKYSNFFIANINNVTSLSGAEPIPYLNIILPVGISFYTFQTLSYTLDVYYGRLQVEKKFHHFSLYVTFFPQLVAGPIERASNLIHQLKEEKSFDVNRIKLGLQLIAFGLFKKVVVADHCGVMVDYAVANNDQIYGLSWYIMCALFAIQIYCDFSGYSDIARGAAQTMGYDLMINFNQPFLAPSIAELWNRWHLSLTTWFRDYIYLPLSKGKKKKSTLLFNLFLIYFISGVWHGASWTYVFWGAINGGMIVIYQLTKKRRKKIKKKSWYKNLFFIIEPFEIFTAFSFFAILAPLFRIPNLEKALSIYGSLFTDVGKGIQAIISNIDNSRDVLLYLGSGITHFSLTFLSIFVLFLLERLQQKHVSGRTYLNKQHVAVRWGFYLFLIFSVVLTSSTVKQPFIYFQF